MPTATKVDKQAGRRARMLEEAMLLARDGGYEAVQMRDVAARAEVALGTLYRYYPSKDALLLAGLVEWTRYVRDRLGSMHIPGATPAERLANALVITATMSDAQPRLMTALVTALGSTDPATVTSKAEIERAVGGLMADIIGTDVPDFEGIRRVIGHVWFSSIMRWVSGRAPVGSVGADLGSAVRLLLDPRA